MAFSDWHGFIFQSVTKHILDRADADSLECVVEFATQREDAWKTAATNVEATIDGPRMIQLSQGAYRAEVDLFIIASSLIRTSDGDGGVEGRAHMDAVGKIADWLDQCILVIDYGATNSVTLGQLKPDNGDDGIVPINLKPTQTDDRYHSTIQGSFSGRFNE